MAGSRGCEHQAWEKSGGVVSAVTFVADSMHLHHGGHEGHEGATGRRRNGSANLFANQKVAPSRAVSTR
jgi:hypothetical protein